MLCFWHRFFRNANLRVHCYHRFTINIFNCLSRRLLFPLTGHSKNHMIDVAMNAPGCTTSAKRRIIVVVDMSASNIEIEFDSAAAAKAYWIKQPCKCGNKFEVRYCSSKANYGCLTRSCPEKEDKCFKSWAIIHPSCKGADGQPRCDCGEVPEVHSCTNTKNAGRSFYSCEACDFFLWVDPNMTLTPLKTRSGSLKRKAPDAVEKCSGKSAESSPATVQEDSDKRQRAETTKWTYTVQGQPTPINVEKAFCSAKMAAVLDKKVIDKLRVGLKELLNQAKPEDRIKVARRFYYKSATEHKMDDDVSDGDCEAFLASLEEKPSPSTSYVVVNLPAPEISVATVKSYIELATVIGTGLKPYYMAVDAQAGAKVMFENPLDTLNAIAKFPNAKAAAPLKPMIFPVVLTPQDVQPILKGVGKMMYVGDATWLYFHDGATYIDVLRGCQVVGNTP